MKRTAAEIGTVTRAGAAPGDERAVAPHVARGPIAAEPPPAGRGATERLVELAARFRKGALDAGAIRAARRHLVDTVGVMIAGANADVASRAADALARLGARGEVPVPGSTRRANVADAAFLGAVSAHGLELDDGYREGSVHPGAVVVPVALATAFAERRSGRELLAAIAGGYEVVTALGRACHPRVRGAGFHPTSVVGPFGAAFTAALLRGSPPSVLANAIGIAASSAAGLFAFVNGGADAKRLQPGHAARGGLLAVLLAEEGVAGPPRVLEGRDGFFQAFAGAGEGAPAPALRFAPGGRLGIIECYLKPWPCCRHLHPALDALLRVVRERRLRPDDVTAVEVETYRLAAEHARIGWGDFGSAQLSFGYVLATALLHRGVELEHFDAAHRADPAVARIARRIRVAPSAELDAAYPARRPARVTVRVGRLGHMAQVDEAPGAPERPLDDGAVKRKFTGLAAPILGPRAAGDLLARLWEIEGARDVAPVLARSAPAVPGRRGARP